MPTGTEGNDQLANDRSVQHQTIDALGGDDQITVQTFSGSEGSVIVHGGDGYDSLLVSANRIDSVNGSGTSGTIHIRSSLSFGRTAITYDSIERIVITGGDGHGAHYVTGDSDDEFHISAYFGNTRSSVSSGGGNDAIYFYQLQLATGTAGAGNDLIDFSAMNPVPETGPHPDRSPRGTGYGEGGNDTLIGSIGRDHLDGGEGDDTIDGRAGPDRMIGGAGNDNYVVDDAGDLVVEEPGGGTDTVSSSASHALGPDVENLILTGTAPADGTGNSSPNSIAGNSARNVIDGGGGADTMAGGAGDDKYVVGEAGDVVIEAAGQGYDSLLTTIDYVLAAGVDVEVLAVAPAAANSPINLTGNELDNVLYGSFANNVLDGGTGADTMFGFAGDDRYQVDHSGDLVVESAGEGYDSIVATVSYALAAGSAVEVVAARPVSPLGAIDLTGNELANVLYGSFGDNALDGGAGADIMFGFTGDDVYYADHSGDVIVENGGEGHDVLFVSSDYALGAGASIEVIVARHQSSTAALALAGNEFAQAIYGSVGENAIDGGGGADVMFGLAGDDRYLVDDAGDIVVEAAGEGHDSVSASVSYALASGSHVEVLAARFQASNSAIDLAGNELGNAIYGSVGDNRIDGGGGADILFGFAGDDSYFVDAGDLIVEAAGEGQDVAFASGDFTLNAGSAVEIIVARYQSSSAPVALTGNELGQVIYGSVGSNVLDGGGGTDFLMGFAGADTFAFTTALGAGNVDYVLDFEAGLDKVALDDAVFAGLVAGSLPPGAFRTGSAALDADDRILYDPATGALYFDPDGSGSGAAVQFAALQAGLPVSASDFTVI